MLPMTYNIPAEYEQVEYITLQSNAYIKLNFTRTTTYAVDCDLEVTDFLNNYWYGQQQNSSSMIYNGLYGNGTLELNWTAYTVATDTKRIRMVQAIDPVSATGVESVITERRMPTWLINNKWKQNPGPERGYSSRPMIGTNGGAAKNLLIGACYNVQGGLRVYGANMVIRYFRVHSWDPGTSEVTYLELIPCKKISTGEGGLYDITNSTFYGNAYSTGSIVATEGVFSKRKKLDVTNINSSSSTTVNCPKEVYNQGSSINALQYQGDTVWTRHSLLSFTPVLEDRNGSTYLSAESFAELKAILELEDLTFNDITVGFVTKRHKSGNSEWHKSADLTWCESYTSTERVERGCGSKGFSVQWHNVWVRNPAKKHTTTGDKKPGGDKYTVTIDSSTGELLNFRLCVSKTFCLIKSTKSGTDYRKKVDGTKFFYANTTIAMFLGYSKRRQNNPERNLREHGPISYGYYTTKDNGNGVAEVTFHAAYPPLGWNIRPFGSEFN